MAATWTKLRHNGEWGIKATAAYNEGDDIEVTKRDGGTKKAKVGRFVHKGRGQDGEFYIYEVHRKKQEAKCPACATMIDLTDGIYWTANLGPMQKVHYCIGCVGLKPEATAAGATMPEPVPF